MGQREVAANETRAKIVAAAERVLAGEESPAAFTLDAVAKAAGVARMTVYYQFESKAGLLEAVFDHLGATKLVEHLVQAFRQPEPLVALGGFIRTFATFSTADRMLIRRLRTLALTDPEIEAGMRSREERRRDGAREILGRLTRKYGRPTPEELADTLDMVFALTSFETFDSLVTPTRSADQAAATVEQWVLAKLGLPPESPPQA
jgi:AcrR family transcriptional regulator